MKRFARLDGIITVVDAKHIEQHLDEEKPEGAENESEEQVAFADRILLNKTDLVAEADLERIEARLKSINRFAPIVRCCQSEVDVGSVLNIKGFDLQRTLEIDPEFLDTDSEHVHDSTVTSLSIVQSTDVHMMLLNEWLSTLLKTKGPSIFRMKGVLAISQAKHKYVYQGVHMIFDGKFDDLWAEGEPRQSKLVFIGKNLDHDELKAGFLACLDSPENQGKITKMQQAAALAKAGVQQANMLLDAARKGDVEVLQQQLSKGVNPSQGNEIGQTALHMACIWAISKSVDALINAGANVNAQNTLMGETPLHSLARVDKGEMPARLEIARKLIDAGADLKITDGGGFMAYESERLNMREGGWVDELREILTPPDLACAT